MPDRPYMYEVPGDRLRELTDTIDQLRRERDAARGEVDRLSQWIALRCALDQMRRPDNPGGDHVVGPTISAPGLETGQSLTGEDT